MACAAGLAAAQPAAALNYVTTANGNVWGIHDAAAPGLDTGSIRDISRPTNTSNAVFGFGGLRVAVPGIPATDPSARFNGELVRGFGLEFNGGDSFTTTTPVQLGGIAIRRSVRVLSAQNAARFTDSFTNTRDSTVTVKVAFGGTVGTNVDSNRATVSTTSSGDTAITAADSWAGLTVPSLATPGSAARGPSAVVLGSAAGAPATFPAPLAGLGVFQRDPFTNPLPATGLEANFFAFTRELTLQPGETETLLQYVVTGFRETNGGTPGEQVTAVNTAAAALAATPDLSGLTRREKCTLANWEKTVVPAVDLNSCASLSPEALPATRPAYPTTSSPYDVTDKSITELQADMEAGRTTSQEITRAYLDRIAAYDVGPYGFHAFITVADDAMAQAKAADEQRAAGRRGDLLGIPVAVKDLFDTKDMPTTDGTLALADWRPRTDAFQVARLRDAGAVMLGKTNLSQFANSGSYSESSFGMTWNAIKPSKTPLGSSGGSATATALSLAGFSLGTQTGVSLYAPSTGAGLVTMRGTDGISSGTGVMPLTYLQDFEGPIARTTSDVARILNATTGTDPGDPATVHKGAGDKRPADWKAALDPAALRGKRIGFLDSAFFASPSLGQDDGTPQSIKDNFADFEALGATMVPMTGTLGPTGTNPSLGGRSRTEEGWQHYWDLHPEAPFRTAADILSSPLNLPYNRQNPSPAPRLTAADVEAIMDARDVSKANWKAWLDANNVDAVVYPGFRSDVYDNDGAQTLSSDRNSGVPTSNYGVPTIVIPTGPNPHGDATTIQIVGRAFDDAKVLGFGYALEQRLAATAGAGRVLSTMAPRLAYDPGAPQPTPAPTVPPAPVTTPPATEPATNTGLPVAAPQVIPSAPRLAVALRNARLSRGGVRLTVTNTGRGRLTGTLTLKGTVRARVGGRLRTLKVTFGTARVTRLAPGRSAEVAFRPTAVGRQALAGRRSAAASVEFRLSGPGAPSLRGTQRVTARR
jgi:amidase